MSNTGSKKVTMSKTNKRRLQKDIVDIIKEPLADNGIYYAHDEENMLKGYAIIFGPDDSIYRYGGYCFEFNFPYDYPFSPPKLKYLTNDNVTRFHPNLYRSGKVCISILNTWKGEQWTSCQSIKSVLLMLVTLLHNKSLLNEPGIKETHSSFKSYHDIITYKNLEIAILRNLKKDKQHHMGKCVIFSQIYTNFIKKNKDNILNYIKELIEKNNESKEARARIYNMSCIIDYKNLYTEFEKIFNKI
tara:strand:- start:11347 stop:12081 length:735 start_codon:yes stop_codon:yes gene_type:complete